VQNVGLRQPAVVPRRNDPVLLPADDAKIMITQDAVRGPPSLAFALEPAGRGRDDEEDDMTTSRRAAGLGLLVYAVCTLGAFMAIGSPGGDYEDGTVATFVSSGHRVAAFALAYLGMLAALGLLPVARHLREELGSAGRTIVALAVAAVGTAVTGWFVVGGVAVAAAEGGTAVAGVPHPVIYVLTEIGNLIAVCGPAFLLGVAALILAARGSLPTALRVVAGVAGVCGVLAPFYFTMFAYFLGVIVLGVWFAVSRASRPQPAPAQTQLV
jgi:hypothetical protein